MAHGGGLVRPGAIIFPKNMVPGEGNMPLRRCDECQGWLYDDGERTRCVHCVEGTWRGTPGYTWEEEEKLDGTQRLAVAIALEAGFQCWILDSKMSGTQYFREVYLFGLGLAPWIYREK
jgi:hypothetical protein